MVDAIIEIAVVGSIRLEIFPTTDNFWAGVEVPIPVLPFVKIRNRLAPVDDAISKGLTPAVPCKARLAIGEDEFIPTRPFVKTVNIELAAAVEDTIENGFAEPVPWIVNFACGVVVPIPIKLVGKINKVEVPTKVVPLEA